MSEEEFSVNPKSGVLYKCCDNCRKYVKKYYENNKDKINEQTKEYRKNNKDKLKNNGMMITKEEKNIIKNI